MPDTNLSTLRLKLIQGVSVFFAITMATGMALRSWIAPLSTQNLLLTSGCLIGFLIATLLARRGWQRLAGSISLLSGAVVILGISVSISGLAAPALALAPVTALTACLLIGPRAGWITSAIIVGILATIARLDYMGVALPEPELTDQQLRLIRTVMLSLACVAATAIVWYYERLQVRLQNMALHDSLTGLANRGYLDRVLRYEFDRAQRSKKPLSLVFIDIDQFKAYNDNYGHPAGDQCLIQVTTAMKNCARRSTDFLARYGGDEFALILPFTTKEEAMDIAELMRQQVLNLKLPHTEAKHQQVSISLGVATITPSLSLKPDELLRDADNALYLAKKNGRNQVASAEQESMPSV